MSAVELSPSVGLVLFKPQIIRQAGLSNFATGFVTSIPYVALLGSGQRAALEPVRRLRAVDGGIGLCRSDRREVCRGNRDVRCDRRVLWLKRSVLGAAQHDPLGHRGRRGHCLHQLFGNLGGWFGPTIVGWLADKTGGFQGGLYAVAGFCAVAAIVTIVGVGSPRRAGEAGALGAPAE